MKKKRYDRGLFKDDTLRDDDTVNNVNHLQYVHSIQ